MGPVRSRQPEGMPSLTIHQIAWHIMDSSSLQNLLSYIHRHFISTRRVGRILYRADHSRAAARCGGAEGEAGGSGAAGATGAMPEHVVQSRCRHDESHLVPLPPPALSPPLPGSAASMADVFRVKGLA